MAAPRPERSKESLPSLMTAALRCCARLWNLQGRSGGRGRLGWPKWGSGELRAAIYSGAAGSVGPTTFGKTWGGVWGERQLGLEFELESGTANVELSLLQKFPWNFSAASLLSVFGN